MNKLDNIVDYLKVFNNIETYKAPGQRNMAHGGRIIGKPGGLVEEGVEYYATKIYKVTTGSHIQISILEKKLKTWEKVRQQQSGLKLKKK